MLFSSVETNRSTISCTLDTFLQLFVSVKLTSIMEACKFNRMISSRFGLMVTVTLLLETCTNTNYVQAHESFFSSLRRNPRDIEVNGDPINDIARLPAWNGQPVNNDQRVDFNQLMDIMGETVRTPNRQGGRGKLPRRQKPRCNRRINIENGVTRLRERGNLARFQCSHGYTLIGPSTIVCLQDRWSEPPPICVRGGCRPIRRPQNAEVRHSIGGAVVAFYCLEESILVGDPVLYCNGISWNGTEPVCYVEPKTTTPEVEEKEEWPESVPTPSTGDEDTNWDANENSRLIPVESTTNHIEPVTTSESSDSRTTVFESSTEHRTPHSGNHQAEDTTIMVPLFHSNDTPVYVTDAEVVHVAVPEENEHVGAHTTTLNEVTLEPIRPTEIQKPPKIPTTIATTKATTLATTKLVPPAPQTTATPSHPDPVPIHRESVTIQTTAVYLDTTTTPSPPVPVTTRRRFKIITKRPRRPILTKRPRRPFRRTTTTLKPRRTKAPVFIQPTQPFYPTPIFTVLPTETLQMSAENFKDSPPAPVDYPIAIDKEFLPREQVEPIRPIIFPDMLGVGAKHGSSTSAVIGIVLVVLSLSTFSAGVALYCWRKNKGIARARPYDMDGRTLSAHDANDDFMWIDQRDSGL